MKYEILRDMESFTQEMFNNIIAFQEKEHPAWNPELDFKARIEKLPLHYLLFSNADRDPAKFGPTVAHYYPARQEMRTIAKYAEMVSESPVVVDAHSRNGFIGSLLAQELNGRVIGLNDPNDKPNQIESFLDPEQYEQRSGTLSSYDEPVDLVLSSWMPAGENITNDLVRLSPKIIVYVFTEHKDETSNENQTGTPKSFGAELPGEYALIDEWRLLRPKDLFHEIWPDLTGNIEEERIVRVFAKKEYAALSVNVESFTDNPYPWEKELEVAQVAHEAKAEMMRRGFPPQNLF